MKKREKLLRSYIRCLIKESTQGAHALPKIKTINVAGTPCRVEIADTDATRAIGLMGRKNIPDGTGMLFVYPQPMQLSFWMKNTPAFLDIAFINKEWEIVGISHLLPFSEKSVKSPTSDCIAALEVPSGWFSTNNISIGSFIS